MSATETRGSERLLTIGAVCDRLKPEFPDISISKIRYLEDEGLLTPRRTQGGYRLFSEDDVERLQTILRLQRDEFLPLRVIREELDAPGAKERKRRRPSGIAGQTFTPAGPRTLIGRAPECDIFLDDVTVSRRHAELLHEGDRFTIRDLGSLNGTFVNRRRVESAELHDDDEVQVGKYRMTFLQR